MEASRWIIKDWQRGPFEQGFFQVDGDLLILKAEESDAHTLVWVSAANKLCWIQDLPLWRSVPDKEVHIGETTSSCEVAIKFTFTPGTADTPEKTTVSGTLKPAGPGSGDGNAGTFIAQGSGPPPPDPTGGR